MRKIPKPFLFAAAAAAVVLLIAIVAVTHRPKSPAFSTATAQRGDLEDNVLATGSLQPVQLVSVGAQVSGRVVSLKVALGDHVTKGRVIATIDPVPATNQLKTAQAALAQMIAQRDAQAATAAQADIALKRQATTLASDASSRADYDNALATQKTAKATLDALNAEIAQARVTVDTARVSLGYTNIVAPIEGDVLYVVTKEGQTVNAVQAAPTIVILGDMSTMTVKAQISEADAPKVKAGQQAWFTILGAPQRRFYGTLRSIAPAPNSIVSEVSSSTTTTSTSVGSSAIYYDGLIDVPNTDRVLKADMTAQVTLSVARARGVVTIPAAAIDLAGPGGGRPPQAQTGKPRSADEHTVLVLDAKGRPQPRGVRIGLNNNVTAEVLSGLQPGDKVVDGQASASEPAGSGRANMPRPGM